MNSLPPRQVQLLQQLFVRQPKLAGSGPVETFVLQYIFVEAALRQIIDCHQVATGHQQARSRGYKEFRKDATFKSLAHFAVAVPIELIDALFDSNRRIRGSKSARNLRNELVHGWTSAGAEEVELRSKELLSQLSQLINAIAGCLK